MHFDAAIFEKHLQIGQHSFANARHCKKFFRLLNQVGHLLRQRFNGLRRIAIGAHAKRVLPVDLQQIGSLVENSGDGFVVHSELSAREKIVTLKKASAAVSWQGPEDTTGAGVEIHTTGSGKPGLRKAVSAQGTFVTLAACGPFCPWTISNSTLSPSCRLL